MIFTLCDDVSENRILAAVQYFLEAEHYIAFWWSIVLFYFCRVTPSELIPHRLHFFSFWKRALNIEYHLSFFERSKDHRIRSQNNRKFFCNRKYHSEYCTRTSHDSVWAFWNLFRITVTLLFPSWQDETEWSFKNNAQNQQIFVPWNILVNELTDLMKYS